MGWTNMKEFSALISFQEMYDISFDHEQFTNFETSWSRSTIPLLYKLLHHMSVTLYL